MVAKLELESVCAKGLAHDLVPHADSKGRHLPNDLPCILHSIGNCRRISLQTKSNSSRPQFVFAAERTDE